MKASKGKKAGGGGKAGKEEAKATETCAAIYNIYALDGGVIGTGGLGKLCEDMGIDMAADAEILVFLFMAGCKEYGKI